MAARDRLGWYAERFEYVEVNSSFYAVPARKTVAAGPRSRRRTSPSTSSSTGSCRATRRRRLAARPSCARGDDRRARPRDPARRTRRTCWSTATLDAVAPLAEAGKLGPFLLQLTPAFSPGKHALDELDGRWPSGCATPGSRSSCATATGCTERRLEETLDLYASHGADVRMRRLAARRQLPDPAARRRGHADRAPTAYGIGRPRRGLPDRGSPWRAVSLGADRLKTKLDEGRRARVLVPRADGRLGPTAERSTGTTRGDAASRRWSCRVRAGCSGRRRPIAEPPPSRCLPSTMQILLGWRRVAELPVRQARRPPARCRASRSRRSAAPNAQYGQAMAGDPVGTSAAGPIPASSRSGIRRGWPRASACPGTPSASGRGGELELLRGARPHPRWHRWARRRPDDFAFDVKPHRLLSRHSARAASRCRRSCATASHDGARPGQLDAGARDRSGAATLAARAARRGRQAGRLPPPAHPGVQPGSPELERARRAGRRAPAAPLAVELRHRGWVSDERVEDDAGLARRPRRRVVSSTPRPTTTSRSCRRRRGDPRRAGLHAPARPQRRRLPEGQDRGRALRLALRRQGAGGVADRVRGLAERPARARGVQQQPRRRRPDRSPARSARYSEQAPAGEEQLSPEQLEPDPGGVAVLRDAPRAWASRSTRNRPQPPSLSVDRPV